jgi:hypothetical protein
MDNQEQSKSPFLRVAQASLLLKAMKGEHLTREQVAALHVNGREPTEEEVVSAGKILSYMYYAGAARRVPVEHGGKRGRMYGYTFKRVIPEKRDAKRVPSAPKGKKPDGRSPEGRANAIAVSKAHWAARRAEKAGRVPQKVAVAPQQLRTITLPANATEIVTPYATSYVVPKAGA